MDDDIQLNTLNRSMELPPDHAHRTLRFICHSQRHPNLTSTSQPSKIKFDTVMDQFDHQNDPLGIQLSFQ